MNRNGRDVLKIIYCAESGFFARATGLAKRIERMFGIRASLEEGHDGIYEVRMNGRIVHSNRRECGAMASCERILQEIAKRRSFRIAGMVHGWKGGPVRQKETVRILRREKE